MNFNVVPALAFSSALSATVSLYYHEDLQNFKEFHKSPLTVAEHVQSLLLPQNIRADILELVQPVGEQIIIWLSKNYGILKGDVNLYKKLSWTSLATIDYRRTAENCILSGEMNDIEAFKLACCNGSVVHIFRLWPVVKSVILPEVTCEGFKVRRHVATSLPMWVILWAAYLTNQIEIFMRANNYTEEDHDLTFIFKTAVKENNVGVARFFIEKLNGDQKKEIIRGSARDVLLRRRNFDPKIFLFLLSHMDAVEKNDFFVSHPAKTLFRFLEWPLARFFITMTEHLWAVFPFTSQHTILGRICEKIMQAEVPKNYENIFRELWSKIPADYQQHFLNEHIYFILSNLFRPFSPEYVMTMLLKKDPSAYEKLQRIFFCNANAVMSILVEENKFKAFKNLIQKHFAGEDLIEDFETEYPTYTRLYLDEYYGR